MKIHNLGMRAVKLIDGVIKRAKEKDFEFMTVDEYRKTFNALDFYRSQKSDFHSYLN